MYSAMLHSSEMLKIEQQMPHTFLCIVYMMTLHNHL